jgi:two-component system response regulator
MARNATVLLVEDDAHDVELLKLAFDRAACPFSFVSVSDGAEAVKYLAREGQYSDRETYPEPFLVLLDLAMPVMDGFDVLRWMQNQKAATWPPVFVFSYSRIEKEMQLAGKLGAKLFLSKPVDLDGAITLVRQLEDLSRKAAEPGAKLPLSGPEV